MRETSRQAFRGVGRVGQEPRRSFQLCFEVATLSRQLGMVGTQFPMFARAADAPRCTRVAADFTLEQVFIASLTECSGGKGPLLGSRNHDQRRCRGTPPKLGQFVQELFILFGEIYQDDVERLQRQILRCVRNPQPVANIEVLAATIGQRQLRRIAIAMDRSPPAAHGWSIDSLE